MKRSGYIHNTFNYPLVSCVPQKGALGFSWVSKTEIIVFSPSKSLIIREKNIWNHILSQIWLSKSIDCSGLWRYTFAESSSAYTFRSNETSISYTIYNLNCDFVYHYYHLYILASIFKLCVLEFYNILGCIFLYCFTSWLMCTVSSKYVHCTSHVQHQRPLWFSVLSINEFSVFGYYNPVMDHRTISHGLK